MDQPHSAALFVPTRDFWWNADFVALMARRWRLSEVNTALDVGAGVGHWGRTLLPYLSPAATIHSIEREPRWVVDAISNADRYNLSSRLHYTQGVAEQLPFDDASFDLATCQTLLVHVPDVHAVLREMLRVVRPGGLIVAVEPNNLALSLMLGKSRHHEDPETTLALLRLQLRCERGKQALREGDNSVGDLIPGYFHDCGATDISVYQSDHTSPMIPPYARPEQEALRDELLGLARDDIYIWNRVTAERYFCAGGGDPVDFDRLWRIAGEVSRVIADGLNAQTEHQAGGNAFYLISGRKP